MRDWPILAESTRNKENNALQHPAGAQEKKKNQFFQWFLFLSFFSKGYTKQPHLKLDDF